MASAAGLAAISAYPENWGRPLSVRVGVAAVAGAVSPARAFPPCRGRQREPKLQQRSRIFYTKAAIPGQLAIEQRLHPASVLA